MFQSGKPSETYNEAIKEKHNLTCPSCGHTGHEKEFVSPEDFKGSEQSSNEPMHKGKGTTHHIIIALGDMGGMKQNPDDSSPETD